MRNVIGLSPPYGQRNWRLQNTRPGRGDVPGLGSNLKWSDPVFLSLPGKGHYLLQVTPVTGSHKIEPQLIASFLLFFSTHLVGWIWEHIWNLALIPLLVMIQNQLVFYTSIQVICPVSSSLEWQWLKLYQIQSLCAALNSGEVLAADTGVQTPAGSCCLSGLKSLIWKVLIFSVSWPPGTY